MEVDKRNGNPIFDNISKHHSYHPFVPDKKKRARMSAKEKKKLRALLKQHTEDSDLDGIFVHCVLLFLCSSLHTQRIV